MEFMPALTTLGLRSTKVRLLLPAPWTWKLDLEDTNILDANPPE
jgi:hypothetical protein